MNLKQLTESKIVFFDGGMGTMLQENGLKGGEIPEIWNITHPETIISIHEQYLLSGADIITANTFGANPIKLSGFTADEIVKAALKNAHTAKKANPSALIALDIGPTGKLLAPYGDLPFKKAYESFAEVVKAGEKDSDLIIIETMSDLYEAKAALLAAKENSRLPVIITFSFDEDGKLLTGGDIPAAVCLAQSLGADAMGFNCGLGPKQMLSLLPALSELSEIPICIQANAGLPVTVNGKTSYNVKADEFAEYAEKLADSGASIIGGCCGTTPEHIKLLRQKLEDKQPVKRTVKKLTVISSGTTAVTLGKSPVIIGERINPTGKPKLKQALRENDFDYICREAVSQTDNGAHILDVNVGLPEIDEPSVMEKAVVMIQGVTNLPLQIDSSNIEAVEKAVRICNGIPLINSVNGKQESMDKVFPIVKKYGCCCVALTLDEDGIPETPEKRIQIAEKIIAEAEKYGIHKSKLVFDTLAMAVSTGSDNARTALDALSYIKNVLGVNTVLGVSNISFGLPCRENLNSAFFTMAMQSGLSAGIINPLNQAMMNAYYSFNALMGYDSGCSSYISHFSEASQTADNSNITGTDDISLSEAVIKGLKERAALLTEELLKNTDPMEIINGILIPALDEVGKGFENKTIYLPQLLMSADAAKAAFESVKASISASGRKQENKGKIILATVKGDVHDIGKNIVKVLLENYGFDVIDLGKDVAPEVIVKNAVEQNIKLVGLSALMTTTVVNMEQTIKLLRQKHDCKIMVGGAVLTEEYAMEIGADFYSKDAMGSVRYADALFSKK